MVLPDGWSYRVYVKVASNKDWIDDQAFHRKLGAVIWKRIVRSSLESRGAQILELEVIKFPDAGAC
jgi:hypothetical protein